MWLLLRTPLGKRLIVGVMLFALFCVSVVVALIAAWVGAGPSSEGCAPKKADDEIVQVASGPLTNGVKTAARAAVGAGWDGEDAVTAVAIAGAESGYNREAANSQSTARGMGLTADPNRLCFVQIGIDAVDIPTVRGFWRAVLGYEDDPRSELGVTDIYDPRRLNLTTGPR